MKSSLDLKKLRTFQLVARHQSLRHAASAMHLSVPAVSIQMRALEDELKVKLLDRVGNKMVMTPAGEILNRKIDTILLAVDDAVDAVSQKPSKPVPISLAIGTDLAKHFSDRIAQFIRQNPNVEFMLRIRRSQETLALVQDGTVDLGIGYFEKVPRDLAKRAFRKSGFALAYPTDHPLHQIRNPAPREVAQHRLIILQRESDMGKRLWQSLGKAGSEPMSVIESGNCHLSLEFAAKKIGVALVHSACLAQWTPRSLQTVDFSRCLGKVDIASIWRRSQPLSRHHLALLDLLSRQTN